MDAMDFFRRSAGKWRSQRTTHHLPFRRAEMGESAISVEAIDPDRPQVVEICQFHNIDPDRATGGAIVTWEGTMQWDREGEDNHSGSTVFAIVPDAEDPKRGKMLRERGYAEIMPVAGRYEIDDERGLILITEYETMSAIERFWFPDDNVRMRTSTVTRFGGFSTASFCTETRSLDEEKAATMPAIEYYSALGW